MSADNGFYVAKFPDGYRWCYGSAIENLDFYPEGSQERKEMLKEYFGESPVYSSFDDAWMEATKAYAAYGYTEYGVNYEGEYEAWEETE